MCLDCQTDDSSDDGADDDDDLDDQKDREEVDGDEVKDELKAEEDPDYVPPPDLSQLPPLESIVRSGVNVDFLFEANRDEIGTELGNVRPDSEAQLFAGPLDSVQDKVGHRVGAMLNGVWYEGADLAMMTGHRYRLGRLGVDVDEPEEDWSGLDEQEEDVIGEEEVGEPEHEEMDAPEDEAYVPDEDVDASEEDA